MLQPSREDRTRGALLGLAAGDAVGTTLEFEKPGSFDPITDMLGGGPFHLEPGQWTDDTSMALCLAASLVHCECFDARDQMDRYCRWFDYGYMSSTGTRFDVGQTVEQALDRYKQTGDPFSGSTDPLSAGNGSLMRLAPVVLFYHPDTEAAVKFAGESSRTTHGAPEAIDSCRLFARMLASALDGRPKSEVLAAGTEAYCSARLNAIATGATQQIASEQIRGSGYVVDCLEAALWCFARTGNFRDAVLAAANFGDDADTTAAVCGQIAGAHYGLSGIPESWFQRLALRQEILALADGLAKHSALPARAGQPAG